MERGEALCSPGVSPGRAMTFLNSLSNPVRPDKSFGKSLVESVSTCLLIQFFFFFIGFTGTSSKGDITSGSY